MSRAQQQWLDLLHQDADQAIEALAGLSVHARARARQLVTLAERHAVGGGHLVDSGLQAFQETQVGTYTEITSFEQVPQAPRGSPPPKFPTVPTPGVPGQPQAAAGPPKAAQPKDPPPRSSQLSSSTSGTQSASQGAQASSGTQVPSGEPDPWSGWHSGLLGQDGPRLDNNAGRQSTSGPQAPQPSGRSVYNSNDQAASKARGLQPGTRNLPQAETAPTERRTPQAPNLEQQLMPNMTGVPSTSWGRDLSFCHGAPVALLEVVGLDGDLPPMDAYRCFRPLRSSRPRTVSASLARRGFSLNGFCLLNCSHACGFACSRPVAFGTRRGHANHECPSCHP